MRILLFTTLFPNAAAPSHGVFVENRLRAYRGLYDAEVKVVAPVPWFPIDHAMFGAYSDYARAPFRETRHGVDILHPRYFIPPKAAMRFAPGALTRVLRKSVRALLAEGWDFDLIDAHYFYPDGVAAARIAREFGKPLVVTARGTDVNLLPSFAAPRRAIVETAQQADAVITVAGALKDELVRLGAPPEKISVLRNGVDLELFRPADRETERRALGLDGLVLASVGHLIERKGHHLVIEAIKEIKGATLLIAGDGPERAALEALAESLGVRERVRFLGRVEHEELYRVYSAADIFVLASSREGWPNVLLEAMACGAPCIAADVWGNREVIRTPDAGRLIAERTGPAIAVAVKDLLTAPPGRKSTRAYAQNHSWDETAHAMARIFDDLAAKSRRAAKLVTRPIPIDGTAYRPRLIITVDTEEKFDWSAFDNVDYTVCDVSGAERFQEMCEAQSAAPLYFLTWPLLKDDANARYFQKLHGAGRADCGLHLHQWATAPDDGSAQFSGEFYSFQKNLPREAHRHKLNTLAAAFERVFGQKAVSHRAGRYGIAPADYDLLAGAGVVYDFSPSAGFDFSPTGGPDFSRMANPPFMVESAAGRIFVTPVCGAKAIRRTQMFLSQGEGAPGFAPQREGRGSGFLQSMRLSPEGARLGDLQALTRRLTADHTPVLTFSLHSTTLTPGGNGYAPDAAGVDALLQTCAAYLAWFREEMGGEIISLGELAALYEAKGAD